MKHDVMMQMAYLAGQSSKCISWKVGAIIAKDGRVISTGFNGTPAGQCNCDDYAMARGWLKTSHHAGVRFVALNPEFRQAHSEWSAKNEIHAELNAILYAAKNGLSIDGATMYVTVSPCSQCAKSIAQSGIKKVVYHEMYDKNDDDWQEIMHSAGIEVVQCESELRFLNMKTVFSNQSEENIKNVISGKNCL